MTLCAGARTLRHLCLVSVLGAAVASCSGTRSDANPRTSGPTTPWTVAPTFHSVRTLRDTPEPTRVRISTIGVDASVEHVGRAPDDTVAAPARWDTVGWYALGPAPGDPGPAILLGHVDSKTGPAVFYRLSSLRAGDVVTVVRADGSVVRFVVDRVQRYPKRAFPTQQVYLPTLTPELRLVTCGGAFDPRVGHYVDNVIAYAHLST